MLPPLIRERLRHVPAEIIDLCRPHSWHDLIRPPQEGMKSIREILVHTMGAEMFWVGHIQNRALASRPQPGDFGDLDSIRSPWMAQRAATLDLVAGLTPEVRKSTRPMPRRAEERVMVEDILWHIFTHEQYHRGQVFTRLALLGRRDLPDHDLIR